MASIESRFQGVVVPAGFESKMRTLIEVERSRGRDFTEATTLGDTISLETDLFGVQICLRGRLKA